MITKEKLLETIKAMPEDKFEDVDVLIERIFFLEKIQRAEKDIEEGNVFTHEEVKEYTDQWMHSQK